MNVGTMTGCSRELADMLERRRTDICAVQETGACKTKAGVGIIVSEKFREAVIEAQRYDDRLMKIMIASGSVKIHFFYARTGLSDKVNDAFWNLLDE
ncbi:hypothetical protein Y032_0012g1856 [Ancylostoma ceylanicum]|uniref:Endonuclease/exonuclease/phosphatase domain-containing protein n=1 Tax=Ancylostoma ceylanicum TaxID=53326 RepID=A0A016VDP0_9BILA|nr:hypothetical protein Y032_0012g1856 [Ancylostoma ceylanicum]